VTGGSRWDDLKENIDVRCRRNVPAGSLAGSKRDLVGSGVTGSAATPLSFRARFRSGEIERDSDRVPDTRPPAFFPLPRPPTGGVAKKPLLTPETAVLPDALDPASLGVDSPASRKSFPASMSSSVRDNLACRFFHLCVDSA
jgi:hypothetical protein